MGTLIEYFRRVGGYDWWVVGIELFLIGFVVYWVVDFLEGTRGERLFRGVIFILIAGVLILNLVVEKFGFERLQYLYKGFLVAVLIITVAAFQPEIRRVLMRIGQASFSGSSPGQSARTTEQIITAVTELSAMRTGAIIVIERQVLLGEFIETGVKIDALIGAELLRTIFYPGTALHDMAVVIRGDKLIAANVQLPLAEDSPRTRDGTELGSRHRAALGIMGGSDAIVIVVSEESGIVSVAQGGELTRNVSESQLRGYLSGTTEQGAAVAGHFWRFHKKTADKT